MQANLVVWEVDKQMVEYALGGSNALLGYFDERLLLGYFRKEKELFFAHLGGDLSGGYIVSDYYTDFESFKRDFDELTGGRNAISKN